MKFTFDFEKPLGELQQQIEKVEQVEEKNKDGYVACTYRTPRKP